MHNKRSYSSKEDKEYADRAGADILQGKAHLKKIKEGMTSEKGQLIPSDVVKEALKRTSKKAK